MILVAGSANLDFVVRAPHIPAPGETVLGRDFKTFPGGKGANQAVASAKAGGAPTHMLLGLGNDAFASPLESSLQSAGVTMHIVRTPDHPTGTAFICVSDDAENAITVAPGANAELRPEHLPSLAGFTHLLLQLETPLDTVTAYAQAARAKGVQVVLNAAPARPLPAELLALVDVLVVNEGELAVVSGHQGSIAACLERLAVPTVVVTLGHHGSCARHNWTVLYCKVHSPSLRSTPLAQATPSAAAWWPPSAKGRICPRPCGLPARPALWPAHAGARSPAFLTLQRCKPCSTSSPISDPASESALRSFCGLN